MAFLRRKFHRVIKQSPLGHRRRSISFSGIRPRSFSRKDTKHTYFGKDLPDGPEIENVPPFLDPLFAFVLKNGCDIEFCFRKAGSQDSILEAIGTVDKTTSEDEFPEAYLAKMPIFVAADVLKRYFKNMPKPLIPFPVYDTILESVKSPTTRTPETEKAEIRRILKEGLPATNLFVMSRLVWFLHKFASFDNVTHMSSESLARVFTPNLARPQFMSYEYGMNLGKCMKYVQWMIEDPAYFFPDGGPSLEPTGEVETETETEGEEAAPTQAKEAETTAVLAQQPERPSLKPVKTRARKRRPRRTPLSPLSPESEYESYSESESGSESESESESDSDDDDDDDKESLREAQKKIRLLTLRIAELEGELALANVAAVARAKREAAEEPVLSGAPGITDELSSFLAQLTLESYAAKFVENGILYSDLSLFVQDGNEIDTSEAVELLKAIIPMVIPRLRFLKAVRSTFGQAGGDGD